jgi:hypothetical protein
LRFPETGRKQGGNRRGAPGGATLRVRHEAPGRRGAGSDWADLRTRGALRTRALWGLVQPDRGIGAGHSTGFGKREELTSPRAPITGQEPRHGWPRTAPRLLPHSAAHRSGDLKPGRTPPSPGAIFSRSLASARVWKPTRTTGIGPPVRTRPKTTRPMVQGRKAPLLSHAAKIPRTESYHPDRYEVGFGLGYRRSVCLTNDNESADHDRQDVDPKGVASLVRLMASRRIQPPWLLTRSWPLARTVGVPPGYLDLLPRRARGGSRIAARNAAAYGGVLPAMRPARSVGK